MAAQSAPPFEEPIDTTVSLWRYMDFAKFVSMLVREGLFFTRLDKLGDPFEGSLPRGPLAYEMWSDQDWAPTDEQGRKLSEMLREWVRENCKHITVNCWHMAPYESLAMWSLYGLSSQAICIRTTFERLACLLPDNIALGCVNYIDYRVQKFELSNMFTPVMHKRISFEHEREVRAVSVGPHIFAPDRIAHEFGVWQPICLKSLIEKIYIAPKAPAWFREVVEVTQRKFGFEFPIEHSSQDDPPVL